MKFVGNSPLAVQWHPTKNKGLNPAVVSVNSHKKVWWLGECGHEWETVVSNRFRKNSGCPFCSNQKVLSGFNDLVTLYPELAAEWGESNLVSPETVLGGGKLKHFWKCEQKHAVHEFSMSVCARLRPRGCPVCAGQQIIVGVNDLAFVAPELLVEWDYDNNIVSPTEVTRGSKKVVGWVVDKCGHRFEASVQSRFNQGIPLLGCVYCSGRKFKSGVNDFCTLFPELVRWWDYDKNIVSPTEITASYPLPVFWFCSVGHEYKQSILTRKKHKADYCVECAVDPKLKVGVNDFLSQGSSFVVKEWDYNANGCSPDSVTVKSGKAVWWKCGSGHSWSASPYRRSLGHGCPVCSGRFTLPGVNDLETLNPELLKYWSSSNVINPSQLSPKSLTPVWWFCEEGHEWKTSPYNKGVRGSGCPFCAGQKAIAGVNDLETINPVFFREWDFDKNIVPPTEVLPGSGVRVWWKCVQGHEWEAAVYSRSAGKNCPECYRAKTVSSAEDELFIFCSGFYSNVQSGNRKILMGKEIDIFIPDLNIGIEYNGTYWHSTETGTSKEYHQEKFFNSRNAGVDLFFIWEFDWTVSEKKDFIIKLLSLVLERKLEEALSLILEDKNADNEIIAPLGSMENYILSQVGEKRGWVFAGITPPEVHTYKTYNVWDAGSYRYINQ